MSKLQPIPSHMINVQFSYIMYVFGIYGSNIHTLWNEKEKPPNNSVLHVNIQPYYDIWIFKGIYTMGLHFNL